jgi:hypothetical protein
VQATNEFKTKLQVKFNVSGSYDFRFTIVNNSLNVTKLKEGVVINQNRRTHS